MECRRSDGGGNGSREETEGSSWEFARQPQKTCTQIIYNKNAKLSTLTHTQIYIHTYVWRRTNLRIRIRGTLEKRVEEATCRKSKTLDSTLLSREPKQAEKQTG